MGAAFPTALRADPGASAATFLELGFGARPLGLGEAFVAISDDVSALYYNPAGLALPASPGLSGGDGRKYELLMSHALQIQDVALSQVGFVTRPFGVSLTSLRVNGIERRSSETAEPEGKAGASDMALAVSGARQVAGFGFGATARFIRSELGGASANAFAMDFGVLRRLERFPVSVGAGVANLGTKVRFLDEAFPLPLIVRLGAAAGMTRSFPHALSLQADLPRDSGLILRLGAEYRGFGPFSLRAGFRTSTRAQRDAVLGKALGSTASGLSEFYGFFTGVGVRTRFGNLDYALIPFGELGQAHRVSFSFAFGGSGAKAAEATP